MILFPWNSRKEKVTWQEPASKGREWVQREEKNGGTVLRHDCGGYKTVHMCQNSQNYLKNWKILLYVKLTPPNQTAKKKKEEWQNRSELNPVSTWDKR